MIFDEGMSDACSERAHLVAAGPILSAEGGLSVNVFNSSWPSCFGSQTESRTNSRLYASRNRDGLLLPILCLFALLNANRVDLLLNATGKCRYRVNARASTAEQPSAYVRIAIVRPHANLGVELALLFSDRLVC